MSDKKSNNAFRIRAVDIIVVALVCVLSFASLLFVPKQGDTVTITENGEVIYSAPLSEDAVVHARQSGNIVTIKDGKAYMSHADCPDELCQRMGNALPYRPVVCLPNGLMVTISSTETEFDSITY